VWESGTDDGVHNVALKKVRSNFCLKVSRHRIALHFGGFVSVALLACLVIVNKRFGGRVSVDHWTYITAYISQHPLYSEI